MMPLTIGGLTLSGVAGSGEDLRWIDEFADGSDLVGQSERVTITGALVIQASAQQSGRRMTLEGGNDAGEYFGVITRAEVEALRELAAEPGEIYEVVLPDGREFEAVFSRASGPAVEASPLRHIVPHQAADLYIPTLRLVLL
jgi:hypothetical protein